MSGAANEKRIFGRYRREECGLPPEEGPAVARRRFLMGAVVFFVVLLAAGWTAGVAVRRWRGMRLAELPYRVRLARPEERAGLLAAGRLHALTQPDNPDAVAALALAGAVAAEDAPRRLGHYGNLALLHDVYYGLGGRDFFALLQAAMVYSELGRYNAALDRLADAADALRLEPDETRRRALRLPLVNAQAYFLSVNPEPAERNPAKALHLAQLLVSSRDELPGGGHTTESAAFLDTLACAWNAAGQPGQALTTQILALGLAESQGLEVYLRHYDEFAKEANR